MALMAGTRGAAGCTGRLASRRGRGRDGLHAHQGAEPQTVSRWGCGRQSKTRGRHRSTGTSGTEGGRRGGRSSVTAGQARQTPAREPIRHFCQRKKARPEQRKDLRGTQGRRRPGGRHCGNISFRWGSLPKERASLRNTRAGDSVWWPQRKASDEVTVHCLTSTGIASPRATSSHPLARQGERGMGSRARQGARPAQSHGEDHYKEKNPNPFSFFFLSRK